VTEPFYQRDGITVYCSDNRDILASLDSNSISAVVTDPPYGLSKEPDVAEVLTHWLNGDDYTHTGGGFMGKKWDSFVPGPVTWRMVSEAMKPGAHLLSFASSRTHDLMGMAIRLAGFEIRDTLIWLYGSGFPKSLDVSKAIDATILHGGSNTKRLKQTNADRPGEPRTRSSTLNNGIMGESKGEKITNDNPATDAAREWDGWGTALKPAYEPIIMARKPLIGTVATNVLTHGTGSINVDGCRVDGHSYTQEQWTQKGASRPTGTTYGAHRASDTELPSGRWPPNVILDETAAEMLDEQSGVTSTTGKRRQHSQDRDVPGTTWGNANHKSTEYPGDTGGASRFFYVAKASRSERNAGLDGMPERAYGLDDDDGHRQPGERKNNHTAPMPAANHHPTVKPIALMRWLVRLMIPPGGTVLDPYAGSGTTGVACAALGVPAILIDNNPEYCEIMARRIDHALNTKPVATQPDLF
jgi:DNA modification methylase